MFVQFASVSYVVVSEEQNACHVKAALYCIHVTSVEATFHHFQRLRDGCDALQIKGESASTFSALQLHGVASNNQWLVEVCYLASWRYASYH